MSIQESQLVTISSSDFDSSDYVRVLEGATSRKITLQEFSESLDPLLLAEGFIKAAAPEVTNLRTITSGTILTADDDVILVDTTAGNVIVTLPLAASVGSTTETKKFVIKKISSDVNAVIVNPSNSETIDTFTSYSIIGPVLGSITIISNGFSYFTV